ncbi:hypothetical protein MGSAQ_000390, partial [marine sediment metagenome]
TKIIIATGYEPDSHNDMTPPIIVLGVSWPKNSVYIIGSTLAGIYKIQAVINNAHVR